MLEKYSNDANLVVKHFPLRNHKFARKAAIAALAADRQGKYAEITKVFLENFRKLNDETIKTFARDAGLDMTKFEKDMADPVFNTIIGFDTKIGRQAGVRGVPAVYINGKRAKQRSLQSFSQMIEKELKKKK